MGLSEKMRIEYFIVLLVRILWENIINGIDFRSPDFSIILLILFNLVDK